MERAQQQQEQLSGSVARLEAEAEACRQASSARDGGVRAALLRLAVSSARQEREIAHARLQASAPRLGSLSVRRQGIQVQEVRGRMRATAGACTCKLACS